MSANTNPTPTAPVEFVKQGGHAHHGTAIGRKGKALLITYRIQPGYRTEDDGTRERWISGARIVAIDSTLRAALPQYRAVPTCPRVTLPEPITRAEYLSRLEAGTWRCGLCGKDHVALFAYDSDGVDGVFGAAKMVRPPAPLV